MAFECNSNDSVENILYVAEAGGHAVGLFREIGMRIFVAALLLALPAAVAAQAVLPGQWEIAITTDSLTMADMPPEVAAAMRGKTVRVKHCITPAEAARGLQEMLKSNKECAFTSYKMLAGRLHSEMTCKQPGGTMKSVSDGTFTPTGFTTTGKTVMTGSTAMTMTATTVGRRTGPCAK